MAFDNNLAADDDDNEDIPQKKTPTKSSMASAKSERKRGAAMYGNDTVFAKIAYSDWFGNTTLFVIVMNAIWIGIDVEYNHPNRKNIDHIVYNGTSVWLEKRRMDKLPLEPGSIIVENLFCIYFSVELIIRFLGFRLCKFMIADRWFIFDSLLVAFMVIETWIMAVIDAIAGGGGDGFLAKFSALRLLRLLRLTRISRLIREVPELLTLLKGMMTATRAVSFILAFLVLCMYVFAIIFTAQLGDHNALEHKQEKHYWERDGGDGHDPTAIELFGSLFDSMMTLFTRGLLGDNLAETLEAIKDRGGDLVCPSNDATLTGPNGDCAREGGKLWLLWLFIVFMIISAFCLLNMLIGVLCEVITQTSSREREVAELNHLRVSLNRAFEEIDGAHCKDGMVTAAEFHEMRDMPAVRASMSALGVDNDEMEVRLDQMQESLFGAMSIHDKPGPTDEVIPIEAMRSDMDRTVGLTFDAFMDRVTSIRPDSPASALDIEILKTRVQREEKMFNRRLDQVEKALQKVLSDPKRDQKLHVKKPEDDTTMIKGWLRNVPTEILFSVLQSRVPSRFGASNLRRDPKSFADEMQQKLRSFSN